MDELTLISSGLYKLTSDIIGAEPIIKVRRGIMDLGTNVESVEMWFDKEFEKIYSGSRAEGFRLSTSDTDYMWVRRGVRVIFSLSQCSVSDNEVQQTLLLAESDKTKPGFVILQLISEANDAHVLKSCLQYGTRYYLSSSLWFRHLHFAKAWPDSSPHGPCRSGILSNHEVDHAECIKSDTIPDTSKQTFFKLYKVGHLTREKLESVYRTGCHFVAICSKNPTIETLEWRISFSSAEKVIIHSMNQTQFLCYGLLKIFLKEAIEVHTDIKGLLCSYFMKTIVFWKLIDETMRWSPQYFIECFLECLRVLIHCVEAQYFPNFFIPENNMFADKFTGTQQSVLISHLSDLLSEGIHCLLRCPSLSGKLNGIIQRPLLILPVVSDLDDVSKSRLDWEMISEICFQSNPASYSDAFYITAVITYLEHLSPRDMLQDQCIGTWRKMLIKDLILLISRCPCGCKGKELNKTHYKMNKKCLSTMKSCVVDATSHLMYMAVYLYRYEKYNEVLQVVSKVKSKLQDPNMVFTRFSVDKYVAAGGEAKPILEMMRTVLASPVAFNNKICIPELRIECLATPCILNHKIRVPALVCAKFFIYLCHHHLGSLHSAEEALQELSTLIHYDDGYYIGESETATSWEILGICQEMSGYHNDAYHSYSYASQHRSCDFKSAAQTRMRNVRR